MTFPRTKYTDREYMEMIYSLVIEMNNTSKAQHQAIINSMVSVQKSFIELQQTLFLSAKGLEERSEKRYEEEIFDLETKIKGFEKLLEEKKNSLQQPSGKTSQDIEKIAINAYAQQQTIQLAEQHKADQARKLKWQDLAIGAIVSYLAVQLVIQAIGLLAK